MILSVYLSLTEDGNFHTIILKKEIDKHTYILAIGYAGGQVFDEFYGKFWSSSDNVNGLYSRSTGSGMWDHKVTSLKFNSDRNLFNTETEEYFEFMDIEEERIQWELVEECNKYIHFGYDEETKMEYETPEVKPIDTSIFTEFDDNKGSYCSDTWGDEWLEITNSDIWGLSLRFPHIIESYL